MSISEASRRAAAEAVARFESGSDGPVSVNLNKDKAGLSWGVLNFSQAGGGLYLLLLYLWTRDPERFGRYFGPSYAQLLETTRKRSKQPVDGALLWHEPWVSRFRAAGADPVIAQEQWNYAMYGPYMEGAEKVAAILGLTSRLGLAVGLDRSVQQGPGRAQAIARKVEPLPTQRARVERFYELIAPYAGEWSSDVLRRGRELMARTDLASESALGSA